MPVPVKLRAPLTCVWRRPDTLQVGVEDATPISVAAPPRADAVIADRAYTTGVIRTELRRRRITAVIPAKSDQIAARKRRGSKGGRRPVVTPDKLRKARAHIAAGLTVREAAARLKIGKTALYKALENA